MASIFKQTYHAARADKLKKLREAWEGGKCKRLAAEDAGRVEKFLESRRGMTHADVDRIGKALGIGPIMEERERPRFTIQIWDAAARRKRLVRGYRDRAATEQLAAKLERNQARGEQDLLDPYADHKRRPLLDHLADFIADKTTEGKDAEYLYTFEKRIRRLVTECNWQRLTDVEPNSFLRWRQQADRVEKRPGLRVSDKGLSATTLNQYLESARTLLTWCVDQNRIADNALRKVAKVEGLKRRKRRALDDESVARLLAVAPEDRRLVYRVGLALGLRRGELEALQWGDLRLNIIRDGKPAPIAQLRAEATKAKRGDKLPMPPSLADDLRAARPADAPDSARVFASVPSIDDWRVDLAAAGIPYTDAMGRVADFHAGTRKTLCTRMHRQGVPLVIAQRIMRHTDVKLTAMDYVDDDQLGGAMLDAIPEVHAGGPVPAPGAVQTARIG